MKMEYILLREIIEKSVIIHHYTPILRIILLNSLDSEFDGHRFIVANMAFKQHDNITLYAWVIMNNKDLAFHYVCTRIVQIRFFYHSMVYLPC